MKVKFEKKWFDKLTTGNQGFALLFSVLISSLLLTIGLSIFSIALKELAISTATRQSIHAFYAADSGREYILYLDLIKGTASSFNPATSIASVSTTTAVLPVDADNSTGPNFYVGITKSWLDASIKTKIKTDIVSYGHDTLNGDRVERAIFQSY
jgi:Tfp pilus assembly protein PilX